MDTSVSLKLIYSKEVAEAKEKNLPIVALESTIITHGMEFPRNYETAAQVESTIRDNGAVPATIVILKGAVHVGLSDEQLKEISQSKDFVKCSTRDLPYALLKKQNGSTTVAATMLIAHRSGIKVFVTGGIGGVHFGDEMDVSADLIELSRSPVAVVCAGVKSILDVPRTLEYLETFSVPVIAYRSKKIPEFFFTEGDCDAKITLETPEECAEFIMCNHSVLGLKNGILITNPVPKESEANKETVKHAICKALNKAKENNVKGSEVTPMLLKEINEITGGESGKSNTALIINNAGVGAKICSALNKIKN